MTDDDIWFADVLRFLGRAPIDDDLLVRPSMIAAAVISKPRLTVTTIKVSPTGLADVHSARSTVFELSDRSSQAARTLSTMVTRFITERGIRDLYILPVRRLRS